MIHAFLLPLSRLPATPINQIDRFLPDCRAPSPEPLRSDRAAVFAPGPAAAAHPCGSPNAYRTLMRYSGKAKLFVPPEYEFPRMFGLFSVGKNADTDQYKRTVYLIQRRGEFWCLHFIATRNRGNELAHSEIDLIQLEASNMGSPDFYNPFSWTWRLESDKPYGMFPVPHNLYTPIEYGSGSLAGSLSS